MTAKIVVAALCTAAGSGIGWFLGRELGRLWDEAVWAWRWWRAGAA